MNNYYAVHVRTGYETIVANRILSLNETVLDNYGICDVFVPIKTTDCIDAENTTVYQKHSLSFTGYIFIALDQLNANVIQFIRSISHAVNTILTTPISSEELSPFIEESVEISVKVTESVSQKISEFLSRKKDAVNNSTFVRFIKRNSERSFITIPKQVLLGVALKLRITIDDFLAEPFLLVNGVLAYEASNR